ncbi:hypothetical protein C2S51_036123 [Perilla frutescens var. frutescens]|nr:hypothetical protein C2S51_036123 [Perilla frutescens var. frutescens]
MSNPFQNDELENLKKTLFKLANESKWEEVIKKYHNNKEAHTAKITSSGDTALHIAISNGDEAVVKDLVAIVQETEGALEVQNEHGNTPLHLAAYLGNASMCSSIARCNSTLMGLRNDENETPFFLAVRLGRKEAFYALHEICKGQEGYDYCRRKDGETILHSAISGEYFDLAFHIMNHYAGLLNAMTAQGFSPLHILANKPSAFKSGSQIRGLDKLIYLCIVVDELKLNKLDIGGSGKANAKRLQCLEAGSTHNAQGPGIPPQNCITLFGIFKLISKGMTMILCSCWKSVEKMREKKEMHIWSLQIMQKLLEHAKTYEYEDKGKSPVITEPAGEDGAAAISNTLSNIEGAGAADLNLDFVFDDDEAHVEAPVRVSSTDKNKADQQDNNVMEKKETPILTAARNGVTEMVEAILKCFPVAIHDTNADGKNVVLLAVENRHLHLYKFLLKWKVNKFSIFSQTDKDGNSALHLAARLGKDRPWLTPGVILQMQWEIKWYEFVKNSMPPLYFQRYNNDKKTATEIFSETHDSLAAKDSKWLSSTSNSCSVVAALVATVAFTASTAIPGGVKSDDTGTPALQNDAAFTIFAISSLVALGFSVTSVVMFLAILTARHQEKDFRRNLPMKMLVGLTSLLISIACMLLCFCAGHFLVLKDKFEYASLPLYVVTCLPLTFFAILQFPQYVDLVIATIRKVPQRFPSSDHMPFVVQA